MQAAVKDKSRVEMVKRLVLCKNVSKAGRVCNSIERSAVFRWIFFVAERRAVWAHERSESESEGAFSRALLRKQAVDVKEVYISAVVQGSVTMLHCAWQITPCSPCLWDASCLTSSPVNWSNVGDLFPNYPWRVRHLLGNDSWLAHGREALTCKFLQGFNMAPRSPDLSFSLTTTFSIRTWVYRHIPWLNKS